MSWSVSAVGKSDVVAVAIEKQFEGGGKCMEPEEGIRQAARALIAASLKGQVPSTAVEVSASGSQSRGAVVPGGPDVVRNTLSLTIKPFWNFLE